MTVDMTNTEEVGAANEETEETETRVSARSTKGKSVEKFSDIEWSKTKSKTARMAISVYVAKREHLLVELEAYAEAVNDSANGKR